MNEHNAKSVAIVEESVWKGCLALALGLKAPVQCNQTGTTSTLPHHLYTTNSPFSFTYRSDWRSTARGRYLPFLPRIGWPGCLRGGRAIRRGGSWEALSSSTSSSGSSVSITSSPSSSPLSIRARSSGLNFPGRSSSSFFKEVLVKSFLVS